ncbi:membrane protein [Mycobacterium phage Aegeus]|nr:membrane protein [Mycobacterium phage Baudelaire]WKW86612.1 membrane protein [Mycobacterium phage Aegeus]
MLTGIAIVFFGFTAAFIAAGAYWKLAQQEIEHNRKMARLEVAAEQLAEEMADEQRQLGFQEGYEYVENFYNSKPRGKKPTHA